MAAPSDLSRPEVKAYIKAGVQVLGTSAFLDYSPTLPLDVWFAAPALFNRRKSAEAVAPTGTDVLVASTTDAVALACRNDLSLASLEGRPHEGLLGRYELTADGTLLRDMAVYRTLDAVISQVATVDYA